METGFIDSRIPKENRALPKQKGNRTAPEAEVMAWAALIIGSV